MKAPTSVRNSERALRAQEYDIALYTGIVQSTHDTHIHYTGAAHAHSNELHESAT